MRTMLRTVDGWLTLAFLIFLAVLLIAGPSLVDWDPIAFDLSRRFQPPSPEHWMGTDEMGRDVLARVVHGARFSVTAGLSIVLIAAAIGIPLGLLAGFAGGWLDFVVMRITDVFLGFPPMMLAVAVSAAFGPGLDKGVWAVALVWWPGFVRLVRGQVLQVREFEYVEAARALGGSPGRIMTRHILPGVAGPVIVKMTMDVGFAIVAVASLGFLGLGAPPPAPEWGTMIADARSYVLDQWWAAVFPGLALFVTATGFNFVGDVLQQWFRPTLRTRA